MFHWICPECGREIPPSLMECPACDPKAAPLAAPVESAPQTLPAAPPAVGAEPEIALDPLLLLAEQIRAAQVAGPLPIFESRSASEDLLELVAAVGLSNRPVLPEPASAEPALTEPDREPFGTMRALRSPVPQLNALQPATVPVALLAPPAPIHAIPLAESEAPVTEFVSLVCPLEPVPEPAVGGPKPLFEALADPVEPPAAEPDPVPEAVDTPVEIAAEPTVAAEPKPVVEAVADAIESAVEPTVAAEPEPVLEAVATAVDAAAEPTVAAEPEPVPEAVATSVETAAEPTLAAEPKPAPEAVAAPDEPPLRPTPAAEPEPVLEAVATAVEPAIEPTLAAEPEPVLEAVATAVEPAVEPTLAAEPEPVLEAVATAVEPAVEPTLAAEPEPVPEAVAIPVETAAGPLVAQPELVPEAVAAPVEQAPEPAVVATAERAVEPTAAEKPPSGSWLPLAPLQDYSTAASRAIHPAAPRLAILMPDSGPRMTLPGPTLPPELASFQNANIVTAGGDRRPRGRGVPGWLVTIGVMLALLVVGVGMVVYLLPLPQSSAEAKPTSPDVQAAPAGGAHPLARFIEVTGFRFVVDFNKKSEIHYLVVNHSAAELSDMTVYVTLRTAGAKPGQPPLCHFSFRAPSLGPFESREMTSAIEKLSRSITLPEWQELHSEVQVAP